MKTIVAQLKGSASKAKRLALPGALWLTATFLPDAAQAAVDGETALILNTFSFLVHDLFRWDHFDGAEWPTGYVAALARPARVALHTAPCQ